MVGRGLVLARRRSRWSPCIALAAVACSAGCAAPPRAEPGSISAPATVDPRAIERVTRAVREVRSWLEERYGPPRAEAAAIRLVPDPRWFADMDPATAALPLAWELSDPSVAIDDPPTILLAPCFGSYARPAALARWVFHVEWAKGLAPWLREGLSETVAAAFAADMHPELPDGTLEGLLPASLREPGAAMPRAEELLALDTAEARSSGEAARLVSAGTEGGEPQLVRPLLEAPPTATDEVAAFVAVSRARAARSPTFARLVHALEGHPRASSTTALLEAATPAPGTPAEDVPDAARDRGALVAKLAELACSPQPDVRRLAVYGLGRLDARPDLVDAAATDASFHVRVTALGARARRGGGAARSELAARLLDVAKEAPLEEAPGRPLPALALFDALTGFRDRPPGPTAELSLGLEGAPGIPAGYRAIEARAAFLRGKR